MSLPLALLHSFQFLILSGFVAGKKHWKLCHFQSVLHRFPQIQAKILMTIHGISVPSLKKQSCILYDVGGLITEDIVSQICQNFIEALWYRIGVEVLTCHYEKFYGFKQLLTQLLPIPQSLFIQLMESVHKCPHYQRNCHVQAPCCKIFYPCKLCHDEKFQFKKGCQVERMEFQKVEKIKCLNCQELQVPAEDCVKCGITFGQYSCITCRLYENNPNKVDDIFHCDDCKMCRRGTKQTVTHCKTCGYCVPNANKDHKCISNNAQSNCPVCLQTLLYSTKGYINLRCGHLIHVQCQRMLNDINCPSCGMAWYTMTPQQIAMIAQKIEQTKDQLPPQIKDKKVNVLCNECLHKTNNAPFHFYGIRCEKCGTFNTKMM